jgi:hypothetical protein
VRWRHLFRVLHRDIGYICVALTLAYGLSGLAVNHIEDWNPNYKFASREVDIGPLEGTIDERAKQMIAKLELDPRQVRGHFAETDTQLRVFLPEGQEAVVDTRTGRGTLKTVTTRAVLFEVNSLHLNPKVKKYLSESVIGLVGGASSWLISSDIDKESVSKRFGARFIDIPIKELEDAYKSLTSASTPLAEAERMYVALKSIVSKYELIALTIKCFDLLKPCGTTACLALSKLNDEGIISGCEGDIPTMWTMMVAYAMTGKAPFMANPSSSDIGKNTVDFAHCTIPLNMVSSYALTTHFESGIGIGIKGKLPEGEYYVMKIGGRNLEKLFMVKGHIICNTEIKERCRTQVRFEFATSQDFSAFMAKRLGNHIVLFPTD